MTLKLLGLLLLWAIFIYMEGKSRARLNYLRFQPLISNYSNGTKWLRKHSQTPLSTIKALIVYLLIIGLKVHAINHFYAEYTTFGVLLLHISFCILPITMAPFYFDWGYYKEFDRLANLPDERGLVESHKKTLMIQVGRKQTLSLLISSILLLILQILILHLPHTF